MAQIAVRLSENEIKVSRYTPQEGNYRDRVGDSRQDSWYYGEQDGATGVSLSQYVVNAVTYGLRKEVYVKPENWLRLRTTDKGNPLNTERKRYTVNLSETARDKIETTMARYKFDSLTDTVVWLMENYAAVIRYEGIHPPVKVKRKWTVRADRTYTIHVSKNDSDELTKVSEENHVAAGRVLSDYVAYCMEKYGIHGIAGLMYGKEATDKPAVTKSDTVEDVTESYSIGSDEFDFDIDKEEM